MSFCFSSKRNFRVGRRKKLLVILLMERQPNIHSSQDQNKNCIAPADSPARITLPFKDQKSADYVRSELCDLGKKIGRVIQTVFTSKKISEDLKFTETKPSLLNQQSVVYEFKCDSCNACELYWLHEPPPPPAHR